MKQYENVRALLNDRRYAEMEIIAVQRQIDKSFVAVFRGGDGSIPREKVPGSARYISCEIDGMSVRATVPGTDEWVLRPRGTNNPEGAALQHHDGYTEALYRLLDSKRDLLEAAECALELLDDAIDRTILRYYYCQALTDGQIARTIHFERRSVCKRRNEAVDELEKRWQNRATKYHESLESTTSSVL